MLGILITLTIVSHMGSEDQSRRASVSSSRPSALQRKAAVEKLVLHDNKFGHSPASGEKITPTLSRHSASETVKAAQPLWNALEEGKQVSKASTSDIATPTKRGSKVPIQTGPTTWAPGEKGLCRATLRRRRKSRSILEERSVAHKVHQLSQNLYQRQQKTSYLYPIHHHQRSLIQ